MHGPSLPSFFLTKKNPAEAGDVDGLMKPLESSSSINNLITSASGCHKVKILPLVGWEPGWRSMAQSPFLCGGSWEALILLKFVASLWYSAGSCDIGVNAFSFLTRETLRQF